MPAGDARTRRPESNSRVKRQTHDLLVIGAGPGGYIAAIRAAQLGLDVACVEKERALGGTCLRIGCIPSKALLESSELFRQAQRDLGAHGVVAKSVELDLAAMLARKEAVTEQLTRGVASLFKKNKVTRYEGAAKFVAAGEADRAARVAIAAADVEIDARHVVIATGSLSASLRGVEVDGERVCTSTEALSWRDVPKQLVVIGAGAIGLELGSVWSRLGAQVTVLEYLDRILPGIDAEIAAEAHKILVKQGLTFRLRSKVTGVRVEKSGKDKGTAVVECDGAEPIRCDRVLLSVGRVPNTVDLGLDAIGIELDARGRIPVDEHFATSAAGVYAIGDVIRGPMLAHKAEEEGVACVERIVTGYGHVNYDAIPNIVYTSPEVASVGKTEEELKEAGVPYRKGSFPFVANARAKTLGHPEGRVKILAHAETDRVLGVHTLGYHAGDLIAEATAAIEFGATSEDLARTCHAHPTMSEAVKEAALSVDGRTLNM
jgi:dihydrolipoamide dehydrogenase